MNELIQQIVTKTGIPAEKAQEVLQVVAGYVKQKYPAIAGHVDSALGGQKGSSDHAGPLGGLGSKLGF